MFLDSSHGGGGAGEALNESIMYGKGRRMMVTRLLPLKQVRDKQERAFITWRPDQSNSADWLQNELADTGYHVNVL